MPFFSTKYNKIHIIIGVDVNNDLRKYNFCTIRFWNQDDDLEQSLFDFERGHLNECKIVTFHCEENPKAIYHVVDNPLVDKESNFQLKHLHLKYENTITEKQFLEIIECVVNFGQHSLTKSSSEIKKINEWQNQVLTEFKNFNESNKLSNPVFQVDNVQEIESVSCLTL